MFDRRPFDAAAVGHDSPLAHVDISLTSAVVDQIVPLSGDFVYIDQASTGAVSIELNLRQFGTREPILLAAGGSIEVPGGFASLKINATAQLNKTVRLFVGNGVRIKSGGNVNASSNLVSVVDGGLSRSLAGQAFLGNSPAPAVAAQYAQCQLWNPAASGKSLFLESVSFSSTTASTVQFGDYGVAFGTLGTNANKYLASAAPVGGCRYTNNVAALVVNTNQAFYLSANQLQIITFKEPLVIPQGRGFVIFSGTLNATLASNFEWYEQ